MTKMQLFDSLPLLRATLAAYKLHGKTVGLVPTMGNLHAGHLALVATARAQCDVVITTIFVNPLQFGPSEDLARYPRSFAADIKNLEQSACDVLYAPTTTEIYPHGTVVHTKISVPELSTLHCGYTRPGHFDGVCTVVAKLFNIIQPDKAFFGYKDYQQFHLISTMVSDLQIPLQVHGIATMRESSGLALSSRNVYLSTTDRNNAAALYATLQESALQIMGGEHNFRQIEARASGTLNKVGLKTDYVHICNRSTLHLASIGDTDLIILAAVYAGTTRLIDNIFVQITI
jgi:pantoate--beta-alanine ligase